MGCTGKTTVARCPGCGLEALPTNTPYDRYFNASPACWSVFQEVLAAEFQNAILFGQVHQLSVDAYAAQHAGGPHPDKSVCLHLVGLHLALERGIAPVKVAGYLQRFAKAAPSWPHFAPPDRVPITVLDVATAASIQEHALRVRRWATQVWRAWGDQHQRSPSWQTRASSRAIPIVDAREAALLYSSRSRNTRSKPPMRVRRGSAPRRVVGPLERRPPWKPPRPNSSNTR